MEEETRHPDLLELDALRAGEAAPETAEHVLSCAECRATLDELRSLAGDLAGLTRPTPSVPADVDRAILAHVKEKMRRPPLPRWLPLSAVAGLVLALGLGLLLGPDLFHSRQPELMAGRPEDIDQSGVVDILDAYLLASRIRSGEELDPQWDVNHDGDIDEEDVQQIAEESVALERSGR